VNYKSIVTNNYRNKEDDYFTIYQNMMNYEPENIIRYCRDSGSKPLYISSANQCEKV
jgi:hypothetical protein